MSESKNKTFFKNLWWNLLLEADYKLGLYFLQDPPEKKTFLQWIYSLTTVRCAILFNILVGSTLITTKFKLISVIFCISLETLFIGLYGTLLMFVNNKEILINLLEWCKGLYDIEQKFHPLIQKLAKNHLMSTEKRATKVLKMFSTFVYFEVITLILGVLVLGMILPESILPKFTPIAPFYLPFKNQDNWTAFLMTMAVQSIICYDVGIMTIFVINYFFTVIIHVLDYLDLINEVASRIGREITPKEKIDQPTQSTSKLDIEILQSINESLDKNKNNKIAFDEWMKMLTTMISEVNVIITNFSKFYSLTLLLLEIASLASLFICGLIFTVIRQQYIFAVGITASTFILWIICYINEKILDKFDDIKATLYDIPWYELEPKQAKTLLIVLNCDNIQKGFTAVGIHILTIERFGIIVKAGYTNLLVLKDLVQK